MRGFHAAAGLLAVLSVPVLAPPAPAAGQAPCAEGRISVIFVDNHSIFDPDDLSDEHRFLRAYHLANTLHVRTRESFIRSELLAREGDCYQPRLLEESARILRAYPAIATADVYALAQPDGSWHVVADTKDEWTTKVNLRLGLARGIRVRRADLTEENLLGRGLRVSVFFRERDEQRDVGGEFFTPRVLGTRLDMRVSGGRTRIGRFLEQGFVYPFVGEVGRIAGRQAYLRRREFFPYSLGARRPAPGEATHLLLPRDEQRMDVTLAARLGTPGNLTTFGLGISRSELDFPGFPDDVEVAREGDFGDRVPASPELRAALAGQARASSATRLNLLVGQRNVRFVRRRGLDALAGAQDVAVGTDAGLTLGRSVLALSAREDRPDDFFARARFFLGHARGPFVLNTALALEGRQVFGGGHPDGGWKDALGELDVLLYWQPPALAGHTLFLRMEGMGGWRTELPFQLTLGGASGVRGYRDPDFPAARRLVFNLEDRIHVGWPVPELLDAGFTVFGDLGRTWAGGVPFGVASGWRGAVGGGLRIGFPAGTRGVARLDVAFPLGPDTSPGDWVVRFALGDRLGLVRGFDSPQVARSRRMDIGPDRFTGR